MFEAPPGPGELCLEPRQGLASCVWSPARAWRVVFGAPLGLGELFLGSRQGLARQRLRKRLLCL
jgi:hypothetical protein